MSETTHTPFTPNRPRGGTARWFVLGLLIFVMGLIATIYLKYWMGPTDAYEQDRAAKRIAARLKIEAEAKDLLTGSGWTDQAKGIVRIPLEDAIALELVVLKQKQPKPAYAVGAAVPVPASATAAAPAAAATPAPKK